MSITNSWLSQMTLMSMLVMGIASLMMAGLLAARAWDSANEGDSQTALVRGGFALTMLGHGLWHVWWLMRWMLRDAGYLAISQWYADHAVFVGIFAASLISIGAVISLSTALWPDMRWAGVALVTAGTVATWVVGCLI